MNTDISVSGYCTFDSRSFCTWTNLKSDDFDWTLGHQGTLSRGTGPSNDHSYGTSKGYYTFIETSSPRSPNQKAQLQSESFGPTGSPMCFKFWYHMYGRTVGTLNVYQTLNNSNGLMWTLKGQQGNAWNFAQFTINSNIGFNVSTLYML